jgi:hypothetical protein
MFNQKSVKWSFLIASVLILAACGEVGPSPSLSSSSASTSLSPEGLLFDYFCNVSPNWEQCDETSGTVKNLTQFGLETIYYRRFGIFEDKLSNGTKYITDLKKSTIRFESGSWYYQRDFLFKTWSGNLNRSDADAIERNFQSLLDFDNLFNVIEEIYDRKLQLSDFNPNWIVLESYETNLYVSPEELVIQSLTDDEYHVYRVFIAFVTDSKAGLYNPSVARITEVGGIGELDDTSNGYITYGWKYLALFKLQGTNALGGTITNTYSVFVDENWNYKTASLNPVSYQKDNSFTIEKIGKINRAISLYWEQLGL